MNEKTTFLTKALTLLFVMLFSLTGARAQITLPYEYGFENNNLAAEGWTKINQGTNATNNNEFTINRDARQSGNYGFRFSSYGRDVNGVYYQYLISPEINTTSWPIKVQFSYRASSTDTSYGPERFKAGYSFSAEGDGSSQRVYDEDDRATDEGLLCQGYRLWGYQLSE